MKTFPRNQAYIAQFLFLIIAIVSTWYLLIYKTNLGDSNSFLAGMVVSFGLIIGLIQVWLNQMNYKRWKQHELRNEEYRQQFDLFNQLSKSLKKNIDQPNSSELHALVGDISSALTEIINFNHFQRDFLYPENKNSEVSQRMSELLDLLESKLNALKTHIQDSNENKNLETTRITNLIEEMSWHNEIRDILADINRN